MPNIPTILCIIYLSGKCRFAPKIIGRQMSIFGRYRFTARSSAPELVSDDDWSNLRLCIDESSKGIGAVPTQKAEQGYQPMVFLSRRLKPAGVKYHSNDQK